MTGTAGNCNRPKFRRFYKENYNMDEYMKKYFDTLEQLTILQARLNVLRDSMRTNKFITTSMVCGIFGWESIEEEDGE